MFSMITCMLKLSMQPDTSPPPAPPPVVPKPQEQKNPYEFITDPKKPPKKSLLPGLPKGDNKKQNALILVVGGLVGVTILVLLFSLVFGSRVSNKDQLKALAVKQNELIRVADIGTQKARTTQGQNLATTAKLTFSSQQQPLLDTLKKQKVKLSKKELAKGVDSSTDAKLTQAEQNNRFDEVFIALLSTQLRAYQQDLKAAYDNTSNKSIKTLLNDQYKNSSLFIEQNAK